MYPINWIDNTAWGIGRLIPEKSRKVNVVLNSLIDHRPNWDLNIFIYSEPPEIIGGIDSYVLNQWKLYDYVLTWDENILANIPNARKMLYIDPWITDEFISKEKEFKLSFLRGAKSYAPGHQLRWEVWRNKEHLNIPLAFYEVMPFDKNVRQTNLFSDSQFNLSIENSQHSNYFTEKILDCFLTKTVPIYWGCPNIGNFFNENGIISFENTYQLPLLANHIPKDYYADHIFYIEDNYQRAVEMTKDIGFAGWKILDRMIDSCLEEKYGHS